MAAHRIISLLPGATEMVAALGAGSRLVGISHECDWPPNVQHLPRVTTTPIDRNASSAQIDARVRAAVTANLPVIALDAELLRVLEPDLVITQVLCNVCAVSNGETMRLASALPRPPAIVTLRGETLQGVFDDIAALGETLGLSREGEQLRHRLMSHRATLQVRYARSDPPTVMVIEWLEPCFLAGHWTPELIAAAGGHDIAMAPGQHSVARKWSEVLRLDPDVVVIALCGFDEERARQELTAFSNAEVHRWLGERRTVIIDGNAYTSRAGPRLIEAIEVLGEKLES